MPPAVTITVTHRDPLTAARRGVLHTPHGDVQTPTFMAVGTRGTVKGLTPVQVRDAGIEMMLGNTYHLALRPTAARVAALGGLHRLTGWDGPMLTDSGGYQVFSLADLRRIGEDGVRFKSHIDGAWLELGPESATAIQEQLGADVAMCFDECPSAVADERVVADAVRRTTAWAARCKAAHRREDQALFGIVQGGTLPDLRARSATELVALDFPGYAVGGLSVGESAAERNRVLDFTVPLLPEGKPRYLMGVGRPEDLIEAVCRGVDMFDCVMPTRNGRNALAFTSAGPVRLRNQRYTDDAGPLDPACGCYTCRTFSRAYLRHLFQVEEMLGPTLVSLHNLAFYAELMRQMREEIERETLATFRERTLAALGVL